MNQTKVKIILDIILILVIVSFGIWLNKNLTELIKDPCKVCISKGFQCINMVIGG